MPARKPARKYQRVYQRVIEDALEALGRNDLVVEHVSVASGVISAAFVRGLRTRRMTLPLERVVDRAQVRAAVEAAIADLTPRRPDRDAPSVVVPRNPQQQ